MAGALKLAGTVKEIAAVILQNPAGEFLLYRRDDKPEIPFPDHWDLFGGHVEAGESVEEALRRELLDELELELRDYRFFRRYECLTGDAYPNVKHIFSAVIDARADQLTLHEGQYLAYFRADQIPGLRLANILKQVLLDFIAASR